MPVMVPDLQDQEGEQCILQGDIIQVMVSWVMVVDAGLRRCNGIE